MSGREAKPRQKLTGSRWPPVGDVVMLGRLEDQQSRLRDWIFALVLLSRRIFGLIDEQPRARLRADDDLSPGGTVAPMSRRG
jgi:hypothetical protein